MTEPVIFYPTDVSTTTDFNRLSTFNESYIETFLESLTNGKRELMFGTHTPFALLIAPPSTTVRIPTQYLCVEGRTYKLDQVDIPLVHPAPGVPYDFGIYSMLRLDDVTEMRNNVNVVTFVQTPTPRVTHRLEVAESVILNAPTPGPIPVPPTGPGVPGPGQERLGFVLIATFQWDGVAAVYTIVHNTADVVNIGSSGLPPHASSHVSGGDLIPYPTAVARGVMPERSLPYLKNALQRVVPAAGAPFSIVAVGANGPAGDGNYDNPYDPLTNRGASLALNVDPSLTIAAGLLRQTFGTPPGGTAGALNASARADHVHIGLPNLPTYFSPAPNAGPGTYGDAPHTVPVAIQIDAGRPNQVVMLQVDLRADGPNSGVTPNTLRLTGGGGMQRFVIVEARGGGDSVGQSTTVFIRLDGTGSISIFATSTPPNSGSFFQYRIGYVATFGQG